ncbi:MAG: Phage protein [Candidatus Saccharibacteria bacterium]|nr:Phage protein [Candidatus Saccharibacteria bacterium]
MVDAKTIQQQLKKIKFGGSPWNQAELRELPKIIHDGEVISECVNGFYEGGVALLVATEMRVLLIDKKPLNYLTVEDLRFDMINEIDYSHRLMGASITISTGSKTLKFNSYNQPRLRHLIGLVQEHMSAGKKEQSEKAENQQQHLEEINKQLQMYLLAQHQHLQQQTVNSQPPAGLLKPDPQLSDYLFAQRLLEQFQRDNPGAVPPTASLPAPVQAQPVVAVPTPEPTPVTQADLVEDAKREVFGSDSAPSQQTSAAPQEPSTTIFKGLEISPLRIAYSKLPMMLRNRKFGRPSFHAHSQQEPGVPTVAAPSGT